MLRATSNLDLPDSNGGRGPGSVSAEQCDGGRAATGRIPKVPDGFIVGFLASGFKQPRTLRGMATSFSLRAALDACSCSAEPAPRWDAGEGPRSSQRSWTDPIGIAFHAGRRSAVCLRGCSESGGPLPVSHAARRSRQVPPQSVVGNIPTERHWTRDVAVSRDGKRLFVSVGSASNLGVGGMPDMTPEKIRRA